jgi:acryloyl-coenzyme A reductase
MKAAVVHEPGGPDVFRIEEVPRPTVGPDDALVQVKGCGVSSHDIVARDGTYRRGIEFPVILGIEVSGTVEEVGDAVADLEPGDRVASKPWHSCGRCRYCRNGMETSCVRRRSVGHGGYAEYIAMPAETLVKVPEGVAPEVAAILGAATGVALNATRDTAGVTIGEDVLVTGASGGVGFSAVQISKLMGARVLAQTRSEEKRGDLIEAGADEVVVAPDREHEFFSEVKALTDGKGVEVVIDTVGSAVFTSAFRSLAMNGRYAVVGQLAGEEVSINLARVFFKRAQLLGVGSVSRAQLEDAIRLVSEGRIAPRVARVLPLDDVAEAHRLTEDGSLVGRIVLAP